MIIEIDRIKYHTIQDLLLDYDFIKHPTSEQIIFLDLNEAGHYYPYSTTQLCKFNSLYHIYKTLHIKKYTNTYFYYNDKWQTYGTRADQGKTIIYPDIEILEGKM